MNQRSLRDFFAVFEMLTGIAGLILLGIGLVALPSFGIVYVFSSIPALLFGLAGLLEWKHLQKPEGAHTPATFPFIVLAFVTGLAALAVSYDFARASAGILHTGLWLFFNTFLFLPVFLKILILFFATVHLWLLSAFRVKKSGILFWITLLLTLLVVYQCSFLLQIRHVSGNLLNIEKLLASPLPGKGVVRDEYALVKSDTQPGTLSALKEVRALRYYEFRSAKGAEVYVAVAKMNSAEAAGVQFQRYVENLLYLQDSNLKRESVEGVDGFTVSTDFAHDAFLCKKAVILNVRRKHRPDPISLQEFKVFLQALLDATASD